MNWTKDRPSAPWLWIAGVILVSFTLAHAGQEPEEEVTLGDLLTQMISLEHLTQKPRPGVRCIQFSSYDRKSRIENGQKLDWFANVDIGNYLRTERTARGVEYVMAEAEGPGALVRFWSANPGRRVWRVYLDGAEEPVIEAEGKDLLGGEIRPWTEPFAGKRSMGYNFIFPLPFQKGMKVTVTRPDRSELPAMMYYHVNVLLFPQGTRVRTFTMDQLQEEAEKIAHVAEVLQNPGLLTPAGLSQERMQLDLAPGEERQLMELSGPTAIRMLELEVSADNEQALKDFLGRTLFTIRWDNQERPAVSSPLGDFFGSSPGVNEMNSLPLTMQKTGNGARLVSRWVMPFGSCARLALRNQSHSVARVEACITHGPWDYGPETLYFHAAWREVVRASTRPEWDWRLLAVQGAGRYAGTQLNVRNPLEHFWWGEGDEKVYVDGEEFPSTFGTGTEDYFGYAWCTQYYSFIHAYHGISRPSEVILLIPQGTPWLPWKALSEWTDKQDITSQYRFHFLDNIPFHSSLIFDMEVLHHRECELDMNAVTYWYAEGSAADDRPDLNLAGREVW